MVSHSALKVTWVPGAVDVPAHRIIYSTNHGSDVKQVIKSLYSKLFCLKALVSYLSVHVISLSFSGGSQRCEHGVVAESLFLIQVSGVSPVAL